MITNVDGYKGNNCYTRRYITGGLWAWSAKPTWVGNGPYSCPSISGTSQVSGTSRVPQLPHCLSSCVPAIVSRSHRVITSHSSHCVLLTLSRVHRCLGCWCLPSWHFTSVRFAASAFILWCGSGVSCHFSCEGNHICSNSQQSPLLESLPNRYFPFHHVSTYYLINVIIYLYSNKFSHLILYNSLP